MAGNEVAQTIDGEHLPHLIESDAPRSGFLRRLAQAAWNLLQAAILLYGTGTCAYLAARVAVGERWNVVALANNFIPWWALIGVLLGAMGLLSRWRWLLAALQVPVIIAFLALYGDLLLPPGTAAESEGRSVLTVATYNILSTRSDPARVIEVIRSLDADVVGLQEVGPVHAQRIALALANEYPVQVFYPGLPFQGIGLLSRYPLIEQRSLMLLPDSFYCLRAVLDVDSTPVVLYVAHPRPPGVFPFPFNHEPRDTEIAILREDYLRKETGPLLVVGDFNMSDQSDAYRALDDLLSDSFREVGRGMGFTYPSRLADWSFLRLVRIDYIWHNAQFAVQKIRVGDDSGTSDHRPVIARLIVTESAE